MHNSSPDQRHARRQADIKPLMDKLRQWLLDHKLMVPKGSGTMKAIDYSLRYWDALTTFVNDPHTPIDNNWVENQISLHCCGTQKLVVCRQLALGPAQRSDYEPGAIGQAQWPESAGVFEGCDGSTAHAAVQQDQRVTTAQLETSQLVKMGWLGFYDRSDNNVLYC